MIHAHEIRNILNEYMPKNQWVSLEKIYELVESYGNIDQEDRKSSAPGNAEPKWKRNVRNVLQTDKRAGKIKWDKKANYMF